MSISTEAMKAWCLKLIGADPSLPKLSLEQYTSAIPNLDSLADVPSGTAVLVRGDVDAKPGDAIGKGDIRLRSMKETLDFGIERGWVQIVFGHIGRDPEGSLDKVAKRLGEILGKDVPLIEDWLDPDTMTITDDVVSAIKSAEPGSVIMLQNTRKYDVERALWKAKEADIDGLVDPLTKLANEFVEKVAKVYVHEAFSAGNLDASSVVAPAAMDKVALGKYIGEQFEQHIQECLKADMVVFSGLKIDKLNNLEAMMEGGNIKWVIAAGSVAMSLKKAAAELDGEEFSIGASEDPANKDAPYYIPPERIEQAKKLIQKGRDEGVQFFMPVDFKLEDASVAEKLGPSDQQFDIGPKSIAHFEEAVSKYLESKAGCKGCCGCGASAPAGVVFHNGVFGMFEDPRFEEGTKAFTKQLKRMTDDGIHVYVGGGEGGKSVERYGEPSWITYCFTAGGTVLKALGGKTIPYLLALKLAAEK